MQTFVSPTHIPMNSNHRSPSVSQMSLPLPGPNTQVFAQANSKTVRSSASSHTAPNLSSTMRNQSYYGHQQPRYPQGQPTSAYRGHPQRVQHPQASYQAPKSQTGYYAPNSVVYPMQQIQQRRPIPPAPTSAAMALPAKPEKHDAKLISVVVFFVFWILVSCTFLYMYMDEYLF